MKLHIKKPKRRIIWGFNPATRSIPSRKRYRRSIAKAQLRKEQWSP